MTTRRRAVAVPGQREGATKGEGQPVSHQRSSRHLILRLVLLVTCVAATVAVFAEYRSWKRQQGILLQELEQHWQGSEQGTDPEAHGQSPAEPRHAVLRERTPHHAKLVASRELVEGLFSAQPLDDLPREDRQSALQARLASLDAANRLAREALEEQPNSWRAWSLLGASTYLGWSLSQDPRLFTESSAWEEPLLRAMEDAGGRADSRRFLAVAYLELWRLLSPQKRDLAKELIGQTFALDSRAFEQLLGPWLEAAKSAEEAFSLIPDRPQDWGLLVRHYRATRHWRLFCRAALQRRDSLQRTLEARLKGAERRLRLGDVHHGRSLLRSILDQAPVEGRFAPLVDRTLQVYPPPLRGVPQPLLERWLLRTLDLAPLGRELLSNEAMLRLASAVHQLPAPEAATVAILADDRVRAEQEERMFDSLAGPAWGQYLETKARWLLARGDSAEARAAIEQVDRRRRQGASYWRTRQAVSRAEGVADPEASRVLAELEADHWAAEMWTWRGQRAQLDLLPSSVATGVELSLAEVPAGGAVVRILWNGDEVLLTPVRRGQRLRLDLQVKQEPQRLEMEMAAGDPVTPGSVRLVGSAAG